MREISRRYERPSPSVRRYERPSPSVHRPGSRGRDSAPLAALHHLSGVPEGLYPTPPPSGSGTSLPARRWVSQGPPSSPKRPVRGHRRTRGGDPRARKVRPRPRRGLGGREGSSRESEIAEVKAMTENDGG